MAGKLRDLGCKSHDLRVDPQVKFIATSKRQERHEEVECVVFFIGDILEEAHWDREVHRLEHLNRP